MSLCFPHIIGHRLCLMFAKKFNNIISVETLSFFADILRTSCFSPCICFITFSICWTHRQEPSLHSKRKEVERDSSNAHSLHTCHLLESQVSLRSPSTHPQIWYCIFVYEWVSLNMNDDRKESGFQYSIDTFTINAEICVKYGQHV